MVCVACLLPLFLIPIINLLPKIFDLILKRLYDVFGWEYKPPVRVPPSCPIRPSNKAQNVKNIQMNGVLPEASSASDAAKRD